MFFRSLEGPSFPQPPNRLQAEKATVLQCKRIATPSKFDDAASVLRFQLRTQVRGKPQPGTRNGNSGVERAPSSRIVVDHLGLAEAACTESGARLKPSTSNSGSVASRSDLRSRSETSLFSPG